jgi:hypothetical protein
MTDGSIVFVHDPYHNGAYAQDNANLFWDSVHFRLALLNATPTIDLSMGSAAARIWGLERHSTANTAGNSLTIRAGGATLGGTDKNGGNLFLAPGVATGTGSANILLQAVAAGSSGTGDRTPSTVCTVAATGLSCTSVSSAQTALTSTGGAATFDASAANSFKITLTESVTLTVSNVVAGKKIIALVCQDGSGSHTWAWPAAWKGGFTVTATGGKCDMQEFLCDGTNCWGGSSHQAM